MTVRLARYIHPGGEEAMLRFGPEQGPTVIAALPLFEEANRTRAAVVDVLRHLGARGIGGALPDLPGTNESQIATESASLTAWQAAFAAAAASLPGPVHGMAWRGGALVMAHAALASRWLLAPQSGADAVRDLRRVQSAAGGGPLFAGNRLSEFMIEDLAGASVPVDGRVVRLDSDPRPADTRLPGRPLWRAAEPGTDVALQASLADDLADWIAACAG